MSGERMIQRGLFRRPDGELQLCSAEADIPSKQIVWVPESLDTRQARTLHNYHEFQAELSMFFARPEDAIWDDSIHEDGLPIGRFGGIPATPTQSKSIPQTQEHQMEKPEIEYVDRYTALGIQPNPATVCEGQCEGTGFVPIQATEQEGHWKALWEEAHAQPHDEPCDGTHFVKCPDCNGTGNRT